MKGETCSTWREIQLSAILSTTNPSRTELGLNLRLSGDRLPTNHLIYGPANTVSSNIN